MLHGVSVTNGPRLWCALLKGNDTAFRCCSTLDVRDALLEGRAEPNAIPAARLVQFDGMGYELPEPLLGDIVSELATYRGIPIVANL